MAAAANATTPSLTPQEVAAVFVDRYYFLLRDSPGEIHKFYQDSSVVSRLGPDGTMISFTTMEEIEKHVLSSLDCKQYDIFSCDSQCTANEGVFVVVVGCFTVKNDRMVKFNQSFILAPMERVNGYFVSNDILIFLNEQETMTIHTGDVPADVSNLTEDDVPLPTNDIPGEVGPMKSFLDEQETATVGTGDLLNAVSSSTQDDVPLPSNDVPGEVVPKKSFLSLVQALNENNTPFKAAPVKKWGRIALPESNLNRKSDLQRKKNAMDVENGNETSIFVGNLAMDSKPEELYEAFKSFGSIKPDGVHIKTDRQNRLYAFIEFESSNSAQSAIQASFIRIGNRRLNIKEKKRHESGNPKLSQGSINGNGNFSGGRNFTKRHGLSN